MIRERALLIPETLLQYLLAGEHILDLAERLQHDAAKVGHRLRLLCGSDLHLGAQGPAFVDRDDRTDRGGGKPRTELQLPDTMA